MIKEHRKTKQSLKVFNNHNAQNKNNIDKNHEKKVKGLKQKGTVKQACVMDKILGHRGMSCWSKLVAPVDIIIALHKG